MTTDTKETAKRLRTEADHNGEDTIFDRRRCGFAGSVLTAFGIHNLDMHVYGLFDKPAGLIDPQSS